MSQNARGGGMRGSLYLRIPLSFNLKLGVMGLLKKWIERRGQRRGGRGGGGGGGLGWRAGRVSLHARGKASEGKSLQP